MNFYFLVILQLFVYVGIHAEESLKKALIFGVTGQDGTYLKNFLLEKNYEVHGVSRKTPLIENDLQYFFYTGDVSNYSVVFELIKSIQPDEIYNLSGQSAVGVSFDLPKETTRVNALGVLHILESIRTLGLEKKVKFFQAGSSEMFGLAQESPQTEQTPFHPRSPYGVSKLYSYWITVNYREAYGIFGCNGILFNHESPLRRETFVTQKIILAAYRYKLGLQDVLYLGNLDVRRDWGYAQEYVEAMWLMLQQQYPDDYVIATGESHTVREFVEEAFKVLGIDIEWYGKGLDEYGVNKKNGQVIIKVDPKFYRPSESDFIVGNPIKAEEILRWRPVIKFTELVQIMIESAKARVKYTVRS